jgi:flagellar hook protein FlgE
MNKSAVSLVASAIIFFGCGKQETPIVNVYINDRPNDSLAGTIAAGTSVQGNLTVTGVTTDLAIRGKGFFILKKAGEFVYYRRPGHFIMNGGGVWVLGSDTAAHLQAIPLVNVDSLGAALGRSPAAVESVTVAQLKDLRFGIINDRADFISPAHATTEVRFSYNLDSDGEGLGTILQTRRFLASAGSEEYLARLFDENGTSLGMNEGDVLTVRGYDSSGMQFTSALTIASGSTIKDLMSAIKKVVSEVDTSIAVTFTAQSSINVSTSGRKGPINNLSVVSDRAESNLYVGSTFIWGNSIATTNANGQNCGAMLRPAVPSDLLAKVFDKSGNRIGVDAAARPAGLEDGDIISVNGSVGGLTVTTGKLTYKESTTTLQNVLDAIQNTFKLAKYDGTAQNNLSVEIIPGMMMDFGQPAGAIKIRGKPALAFSLANIYIAANNGNSNATTPVLFNANMQVTSLQAARDPVRQSTSIAVYDATGMTHTMTTTFTNSNYPGTWLWEIAMDNGDSILGGNRGTLLFGQDGSPSGVFFSDSVHTFTFKPKNDSRTISIQLNMGQSGRFDGITQFRAATYATARVQDGYALGYLAEVSMDPSTGIMSGLFTNRAVHSLYRVPLARFLNSSELSYENGYFTETATSGKAILTILTGTFDLELYEETLEMATQ